MIFRKTELDGAYIVELEPVHDERGFFARTWCQKEFIARGLEHQFVQCSLSYNKKKGIIRGMHYQARPFSEVKLVRCVKGSIFDVIIDLRPDSATFKQWFSIVLTDKNYKALYIPEGFAHGFQTLEDETEVLYQISEFYHKEWVEGVKYNDQAFGVRWPILKDVLVSKKDLSYKDFTP